MLGKLKDVKRLSLKRNFENFQYNFNLNKSDDNKSNPEGIKLTTLTEDFQSIEN